MKLKLIIFQLALIMGFGLQAQKINWVETFGGKGFDMGRNIILDPFGNSIVLGEFTDTCVFSSSKYLVSNGAYDVFISKQNTNGDCVWAYGYGNEVYNKAESICSDENGDIYIVGNFAGTIDFNPGIGYDTLSSWIEKTAYILKISSSGNFVWVKRIGGFLSNNSLPNGAIAECNMIKYDHNGNLIVGGRFEGAVDFDFSPNKDSIVQGMGNYILKLDLSGNFKWVRIIKNIDYNEVFTAIQTYKNGDIISAGSFSGNVDFDLGPDTFLLSTPLFSYANFVLKLNSAGELKWVKSIPQKSYIDINDIHTEIDNKIVLCGNYTDSVGFNADNPIKNHYSNNQSNSFISIWTDSGSYIQSYSLISDRNNFAQSIHSDNLGNIYLSGFSLGKFWVSTSNRTDTFIPALNNNIYLLKFEPNGQIQWGKLLPGNGNLNQSNFVHNTAFNKINNQFYYTGFFIDSNNFVLLKSGTQQSRGFSDIFLTNLQLCNSNLTFGMNKNIFKIKDTASFTCTDALSGSNYQWQEKTDGEFRDLIDDSTIIGSTSNSLNIKNLNLSDNGRVFRCKVLADSCLTISNNYVLNVVKCLKIIDSLIYKSNTNFDEPLRLVVKTSEPEKNEFEWQFFKQGSFVKIPDSIGFSGIENDTLVIDQSKLEFNRNYFRCLVNQEECSEKSDSVLHTTNCSGLKGQCDSLKYYDAGDTIQLIVQSANTDLYSWEMRILGSFIAISDLSTRFKGMKNDTLFILNADANFNSNEFRCLLINGPCQAYSNTISTKLNINNSEEESSLNNYFELFPNPTKGIVYIKNKHPYNKIRYTIFDTSGNKVKIGSSESNSYIDLTELSAGLYFIQLNDLKVKPIKLMKE